MSKHLKNSSLGFLLSKGNQTLHRQLNRNFNSSSKEITFEQWSILNCLFLRDGKSQNEIAESTFKDKVSVTKIIDNLEKNEFVYRSFDERDRRVKRIFLTEKGKQKVPQLKTIADRTILEAFKNVSENEVKSFRRVLTIIVKNITGEDLFELLKNNKSRWK